jgi:D-serine dehydratase
VTDPAPLNWTFKALPARENEVPFGEIASRNWNVLAGDVMLPAAVLRESALDHNLRWMQRFCELTGVEICPHGKTTMAPELFKRQIAAGAWGMTAATTAQVRVYRQHGINRILFANELIGRQNILYILDELDRDPDFDFYCLVDSDAAVEILEGALAERKSPRRLQVLVELGLPGGRAGVRSEAEIIALAERVAQSSHLALRGVEAFEGIVQSDSDREDRVRQFLKRLIDVAEICDNMGFFEGRPLLTAGGSSFFDFVAEMPRDELRSRFTIVLRSGCYVTHDSEFYQGTVEKLLRRSRAAASLGDGLRPAIELWAYVQSRPEPTRIIAGLGKRDASHDVTLPKPLSGVRAGSSKPEALGADYRTVRLDDQHAYLDVPPDSELQVGDMICFGISHPCTTFDRWQAMYVADDDLNVVGAIRTYF